MPEDVVADAKDAIQLLGHFSTGLKVHQDISAFSPAIDLVGQLPAPLFPLSGFAGRAAAIGHDLLVLLHDGLEVLIGYLGVHHVHGFVVTHSRVYLPSDNGSGSSRSRESRDVRMAHRRELRGVESAPATCSELQ